MFSWPFDQGNVENSKNASSSKINIFEKSQTDNKCFKHEDLITMVNRVLSVLNTDYIFLKLNGFNYNIVMKSNSITQRSFSSENNNEERVPFQFNLFESMEDCTCVNQELFFLARDKNPSVCTVYIL